MKYSAAISSAALIALANATPTQVVKRADTCGQWDTVQTGGYTVYNNLWGQDAADSGSQCFGVDGLNGDQVSWHTSWSWSGGQYNVKSYPNVVLDSSRDSGLQISDISSIPSTWSWTYTGQNVVANVAYDVFTSSTEGGTEEFEIMIWVGAIGGAGPISSTYGEDGNAVPVATPNIAGQSWKLYKGTNSQLTVYSFLANSNVNNFAGDVKDFFDFLVSTQGYDDSQYLVSAGAGTEPFTGSNAVFTTQAYSLSIVA